MSKTSNNIYCQDKSCTINSRAFKRDFDEIDYDPHQIDDSDNEEAEKYGY